MKIFLKRIIALILILALTLLSGCGKDNIKFTSSLNQGGALPSSDNSELQRFEETLLKELLSDANSQLGESTSSKDGSNTSSELQSGFVGDMNSSSGGITTSLPSASSSVSSNENESVTRNEKMPFRALWISYYEFPFWGSNEQQAKTKVLDMMELAKNQGYTAVFCHVRANADAFYPSKYFPFAMQLTGKAGGDPGYDPLKIMIWAAKKCDLEIHAWINPYRVSNVTTNPDELADGHIAKTWFSDDSGRVFVCGKGMYFNPASTDVQKLVLYGIREILANYDVDGIHFDDYFYPEKMTEDMDKNQYNAYVKGTQNPLSLADWRRANVNAMVSATYRLCHSKKVVFGISPAANISYDNSHDNYNLLYADIALWMREEGYVDYILPQLYFGYTHPMEKSRYDYLLDIWANLPKHKNLKLYIGLGAYRMNADVDDKEEWHNENDLMARQVLDAHKLGAEGFAVFSYRATASENEHNSQSIKNMFDAINSLAQLDD